MAIGHSHKFTRMQLSMPDFALKIQEAKCYHFTPVWACNGMDPRRPIERLLFGKTESGARKWWWNAELLKLYYKVFSLLLNFIPDILDWTLLIPEPAKSSLGTLWQSTWSTEPGDRHHQPIGLPVALRYMRETLVRLPLQAFGCDTAIPLNPGKGFLLLQENAV